jgi:hypothetical protein
MNTPYQPPFSKEQPWFSQAGPSDSCHPLPGPLARVQDNLILQMSLQRWSEAMIDFGKLTAIKRFDIGFDLANVFIESQKSREERLVLGMILRQHSLAR